MSLAVSNNDSAAPANGTRVWLWIGIALLIYAALGNWLVLPGYRRFLEHGSAAHDGVSLALIWGAARTILWMFSFHLGAFCLAWAALAVDGSASRSFRQLFAGGALIWIGLWAIPSLPGPYTAFFAALGLVILALIVAVFIGAAAGQGARSSGAVRPWQVASYLFFAFATWDICGLGSVGGILHPDGEIRARSQPLVVAQTTKLIVELAIAWALLAVAACSRRSAASGRVRLSSKPD